VARGGEGRVLTPDELGVALAREFPYPDSPTFTEPLWHYTDAAGLHGIVGSGQIRATHSGHLNDTEEIHFGHRQAARAALSLSLEPSSLSARLLKSFLEEWERAPLAYSTNVCIASFCQDGGNGLSQWRAYGAFGAGYSIGLRSLPGATAEHLLKVRYVNPTNIDGEFVERIRYFVARAAALMGGTPVDSLVERARDHLGSLLSIELLRTKNWAFRDEQEWRLIVLSDKASELEYRPGPRGLVPSMHIPLTEAKAKLDLEAVYVGPSNNSRAAVDAVVGFLESKGYVDARALVRPSDIPFRGPHG